MCDKPKEHLCGGLCINLTYSRKKNNKKLASTDWKSINLEALYVFFVCLFICFCFFVYLSMWHSIPSANVAPSMFPPLLCTSFCDKNVNLAHNHRFLL